MIDGLLWLREVLFATTIGIFASLLFKLPFVHHLTSRPALPTLSNGTHLWSPTVLLVSLDGFKPAYLQSGLVPTIRDLANGQLQSTDASSLTAEYMVSVSPSLTFPNHWSLQTGLLPSWHGIVANDFHQSPYPDGRLRVNSSFYYTDPNRSWDAKWWKGKAIWEHLEQKGITTANLMWPGPPKTAANVTSTHFQKYVKGWTVDQRHDKIAQWLDLPFEQRPSFICAYAPDVDTASHNFGPDVNLAPVAEALTSVDRFIRHLLQSIEARNATSLVNVVIVSDHGMTFTSNERLVYLDDALGLDLLAQATTIDGWPNVGLRFQKSEHYDEARRRLEVERQKWLARKRPAFDVLSRREVVERWNWTMTDIVRDRMAELWVLPQVGWALTTHHEMRSMDNDYIPKGNHGYDANHPDMHAFFAASGPAIRKRDTAYIAPFKNLEIHNLVSTILGVEGAPNNGTKGFWTEYITSV